MAKIAKRYCGGRKSPYQLTWCEQGSRHSRFFETERERDEFLRANDYLEKSSFQSLMKLDMDTISDIARIYAGENYIPRNLGILGTKSYGKACS